MITKQVIKSMLKENTGVHMCDSGGENGRYWQQNADKDFETGPQSTLDISTGYLEVTHDVYHWLAERLVFDEQLTLQFQAFQKDEELDDFEAMQEFAKINHDPEFWLGSKPIEANSFNHESVLSQVIQLVLFKMGKDVAILLQIHNGTDVRGGYTAPKAFRINPDFDDTSILNFAGCSISCDECECYWDSDDGHTFESGYEENLEVFRVEQGSEPISGVLVWDNDGKQAFCPSCGEGLLSVTSIK